jgi:hypothetical protein
MSMGFTGQLTEARTGLSPCQDPEQLLFKFDAGPGITFGEATHHNLVTGTTGSGKTTSFILPALDNLIRKGFPGLIIDIKGNLTEKVRALAAIHQRDDDILELGVESTAFPVNFLAGYDEAGIYALYRSMTLKSVTEGHNMAWYLAGVRVAAELTQMCCYLAKREACFTPTLSMISELLTDYPLCAEIFKYFKQTATGEDENILLKQIETDSFHPCKWSNKKSDMPRDYDEQTEWRTHHTRNALLLYPKTPGVDRGFCDPKGGVLEIGNWIYDEKRIVILRFGPQSGCVGEDLSRYCMEIFYQAVFARGLELPSGQFTFLVADEFQDFVDFKPINPLNDNAFTAKSREFNNILIFGTQSLSAMLARAEKKENVESFVNNCNNRIFLYSDDPWTQKVVNRHEGIMLTQLGPGKAAVVKFNQNLRSHEHGLESLQQAYDACQAKLAEGAALMMKVASVDGDGSEADRPR